MPSYSHCILVGNVTRDTQLKNISSGSICDVGIAVNDRRKGANGEWIEECMFMDCTCFGRTAEIASEYLRKGSPVLVAGRLKLDQWEKDGVKHSRHKLLVDRLQMLDPPKGERNNAPPARHQSAAPSEFGDDVAPF